MITNANSVLLPAILSAVMALGLTCLLIRFSPVLRLLAAPRPDRWHRQPTPNTGGIAIFAGCALTFMLLREHSHTAIAIGSLAIWMLGILDDRLRLKPGPKLVVQIIIVFATALTIEIRPMTPWYAINLLTTAFVILAVTNAFNLIDNMDGLCAGVAVIIGGSQALMLWFHGNLPDARLFAIITGSFAGFLVFNYNPARIFMGDSGSMLAGFTLSALTMSSPLAHTRVVLGGIFYPLLLFVYPLFDTALVSALRRLSGRPISQGGRDHSSHRLFSTGLHEHHVTLFCWGLTSAGVLVGALLPHLPLYALSAGLVLMIFMTVLAIYLATLPAYPLDLIPVISRLSWLLPGIGATLTLMVDCLGICLALLLAYLCRYDGQVVPGTFRQLVVGLPVAVVCYVVTAFVEKGIWRVNWKYFSLVDGIRLVRIVVITGLLMYAVSASFQLQIPEGIIVVFAVLAMAVIIGSRSSLRVLREVLGPGVDNIRRIAIFGTGEPSAAFLKLLKTTAVVDGIPVMLLSEDTRSTRSFVSGVRVYSVREGIERLQSQYPHSAVVYPEGAATAQSKDALTSICRSVNVELLSIEVQLRSTNTAGAVIATSNVPITPTVQAGMPSMGHVN
jgi:UDP-GlcNAc:undecaprenyl-phosphate/decaprenyl-phosphate GlcNAc-1-phosphate transferase